MMRYSIKPRTRKCVKRYGFLTFARNLSDKYKNHKLLDTGLQSVSKYFETFVFFTKLSFHHK